MEKEKHRQLFDVTIGSHDGAEVCELVGIYLLSLLAKYIDKNDSHLYRDDGLILLRNVNKQKMDRMRKNIKIFKDVGFKIEIQTNLKIVDFLDVTFNLENGTCRPIKNPMILYCTSIHPQTTLLKSSSSYQHQLTRD